MRRADRLFQLVQLLRRRGVVTARFLADHLEVSERTIYRDVQHLSVAGVPIEGEAGVGYRLRGYDLPPMSFTRDEAEALAFGLRVVEAWTDDEMAAAARRALGKIEAVLPEGEERHLYETTVHAPAEHASVHHRIDLPTLRRAIRRRQKVHIQYTDAKKDDTERVIRPFGLAFYGPVWVLAAWCELRTDYRAFRPDRIAEMRVLDEVFEAENGPSLEGFLRKVTEAEERRSA